MQGRSAAVTRDLASFWQQGYPLVRKDLRGRYPGDFWTDPFPCGIDAILFCHMFTIWSMERNLQLLRICAAAVEPGGSVLLFNMMGDDDRSGPLSTALGSPYFLAIATGEGELHSWSDYEQAMHQAGFAEVKRVTGLPLNHGIIVGTRRA